MQRHDTWWKHNHCHIPPSHQRCVSYQQLICLRQLLHNQLPPFMVKKQGIFSHQGCVEVPMYKIPPPTISDGQMHDHTAWSHKPCVAPPMEQQRPTLDLTQLYCDIIATLTIPRPKSASRVLRTNFVITRNYCSHTGNGVGRGSREAAKTLLYLSMLQIVYYLSL